MISLDLTKCQKKRHDAVAEGPCVTCTVPGEDGVRCHKDHERSLRYTEMVISSFLQISSNNIVIVLDESKVAQKKDRESGEDFSEKFSLLSLPPFLEKSKASCRVKVVIHYALPTFKALQNLHHGISKLLRECTAN